MTDKIQIPGILGTVTLGGYDFGDKPSRVGRLGRKESQVTCTRCGREPGDRHSHFCPKSIVQLRLRPEPSPRLVYMSKGMAPSFGPDGEPRIVTNPGFPYVNPKQRVRGLTRSQRREVKRQRRRGLVLTPPRKDWTAGGLPLGFTRETALEYVREKGNVPMFKKQALPLLPPVETITPNQEIL